MWVSRKKKNYKKQQNQNTHACQKNKKVQKKTDPTAAKMRTGKKKKM